MTSTATDSTETGISADHQARLAELGKAIGKIPLLHLDFPGLHLYLKPEGCNLGGSVKARPALHILTKALDQGLLDADGTVLESSSGNFAIALATICRALDIDFVPVIDININPANERILRTLCSRVELVEERDETGGCLLNRLARVRSLSETMPGCYWPNQYANPWNAEAHFLGTGAEICDELPDLDYFFVGVSSGGTITGTSQIIKQRRPEARIIAVDIEGSVIFQDKPKKRYIPGMGSSMRPTCLDHAKIDDVVFVSEAATVHGCRELYRQHGMFMGGSTGAVYQAICDYFSDRSLPRCPTVAFLAPDHGTPYLDTIYDPQWTRQKLGI